MISLVLALMCTSHVFAFQFQTTIHQHQHHTLSSSSSLKTISKESTELIDVEDEEEDDSWVLRQITFLGLTAPKEEEASDDTSSSDKDIESKNALDARNLSEFLMEIGACSVSITDSDLDTENEEAIFDEPSLSSTCTNDLSDIQLDDDENNEQWAMIIPDYAAGRNLWKRCDVSAHFPQSLDVPTIIDAVRYTFHCPTNPRYKVDNVPDLDWIQHVQESWEPIVTKSSKYVLRFPWHTDQKVMKACQDMEMMKMKELQQAQFSSGVKREGAVVHFDGDFYDDSDGNSNEQAKKNREYVQIELEGGIAFGTGEHPTTRLCLDWIRDKVEEQLDTSSENNDDNLNFLDYGAGSGILGIAAAALVRDKSKGASRKIRTVGVEIDADAIHIANDNAKKNNVEMVNYLPDSDSLDAEALSVVMRAMQRKRNQGLETLPDELNGQIYDLCAANILAAPLVNLAPTIASLVKSGGEIGLSGVLATQADNVVKGYSGELFEDVKVAGEDGGWVLITGRRR